MSDIAAIKAGCRYRRVRIDYAANGFGAWDGTVSGYGFDDTTPVPADYDGDGKADLAIKTDSGGWLIDYASDGFVGWNLTLSGYGGPGAIPVPANYDGADRDGRRRADLAVKSTSGDGAWFVDLAATGFAGWDFYVVLGF